MSAPTHSDGEKPHQQQEEEEQVNTHVYSKSLLQSDALFHYILETSVYPREPAPLRELREMTANQPWNSTALTADEGQFLMMLLKLMNAKNTLELGVYTGYSLLSTALALPPDGKIIAMDPNRETYELSVPFMKKAGVHHKIDFREGQGLTLLEELLQDEKNLGFFDFTFVDADKENYLNYHERIIKLVKVGGLIGYDNTLWNGSVAALDDTPYPEIVKQAMPFMVAFNKAISADPRVEISMISIGDGLTLCRRIE
ncbi:hypothetical protein L7F22_004604 [Adiantum nelumboides]|nr:hypothetical protein [Adiantum nelumboides]